MIAPKKPDAIDVEVGQRVRIYRLQSGLSQTSLAEQLGVTFQQVQKYEKGVNRLGAGRLTKIAKVLGVPVNTLLGAHHAETLKRSDRGTASSPLKLLTVPSALRLVRAYSQLKNAKMRRSIVDLVENIATVGGEAFQGTWAMDKGIGAHSGSLGGLGELPLKNWPTM